MTTNSPTTSPTASGHVTIVFTSDWGVSTGVGQAGRTHSTIERCWDDPVVRGTVITGVLREQAMLAAKALDGPEEGKWTSFALWLFGQDRNSEPGSTPHPRHVLFSDATPASSIPVHDTVSLSIDPDTGTARDQFLRFTERAAAGVLTGTFTLINEAGVEISGQEMLKAEDKISVQRTIEAALFLLGIAGLMVRGIGSGRSGGDGECTVLVTKNKIKACDGQSTSEIVTFASSHAQTLRTSLKNLTQCFTADVVNELPAPQQSNTQHQVGTVDGSAATRSGGHHLILDLTLGSPIVSYEAPFSNEIRSLDFLRGTVLLPWLHQLVSSKKRGENENEAVITNAVTGSHLFVSDALPVISDTEGLPVPLTLKTDKTLPSDSLITLYGDSHENKGKIPIRGGYVFFAPKGGDGEEPGTKTQGWYGKPPLRGRQTTAINHETGAASKGQLVLVEALPEKMCMRAHVWVSDELWEAASVSSLLGKTREARLGSRKLTGTFGSATCTLREETAAEREARSYFGNAGSTQLTSTASTSADGTAPGEGTTTSSRGVWLWFTSDVIARSAVLGAGGTADDLIRAFRRKGIAVEAVGTTSIRHRRVDSWSPADNGPRATRLAIQAGSVIQVHVSKKDRDKLLELAPFGVGELTAQGYGRFVVDHPLLSIQSIEVTKAKLKHFVCKEAPEGGEDQ